QQYASAVFDQRAGVVIGGLSSAHLEHNVNSASLLGRCAFEQLAPGCRLNRFVCVEAKLGSQPARGLEAALKPGRAKVVPRIGEISDVNSRGAERPCQSSRHKALRTAAEDGDGLAGDVSFGDGVDGVTESVEKCTKPRRDHRAAAELVEIDDILAGYSNVFSKGAIK